MELRLFAPEDGEAETDGEGEHVEEGDDQERGCSRLVKTDGVEARHNDGRGNAKENHEGAERGAEPAQGAVPAHMVGADQRGLKNEEHNPARKSSGVDPEKDGARRRGVEQVLVDSVTETPDHDGRNEQRHGQVEVFIEESVSAEDMALGTHK